MSGAPMIFPAPTAAWGTIVGFCYRVDLRDSYSRTTPKEVRCFRYIRQFHRRSIRAHGGDGGIWFYRLIYRRLDESHA